MKVALCLLVVVALVSPGFCAGVTGKGMKGMKGTKGLHLRDTSDSSSDEEQEQQGSLLHSPSTSHQFSSSSKADAVKHEYTPTLSLYDSSNYKTKKSHFLADSGTFGHHPQVTSPIASSILQHSTSSSSDDDDPEKEPVLNKHDSIKITPSITPSIDAVDTESSGQDSTKGVLKKAKGGRFKIGSGQKFNLEDLDPDHDHEYADKRKSKHPHINDIFAQSNSNAPSHHTITTQPLNLNLDDGSDGGDHMIDLRKNTKIPRRGLLRQDSFFANPSGDIQNILDFDTTSNSEKDPEKDPIEKDVDPFSPKSASSKQKTKTSKSNDRRKKKRRPKAPEDQDPLKFDPPTAREIPKEIKLWKVVFEILLTQQTYMEALQKFQDLYESSIEPFGMEETNFGSSDDRKFITSTMAAATQQVQLILDASLVPCLINNHAPLAKYFLPALFWGVSSMGKSLTTEENLNSFIGSGNPLPSFSDFLDAFESYANQLFDVNEPYYVAYSTHLVPAMTALGTNPKFQLMCGATNAKKLSDLLIRPLQVLPKYDLFLKELMNALPPKYGILSDQLQRIARFFQTNTRQLNAAVDRSLRAAKRCMVARKTTGTKRDTHGVPGWCRALTAGKKKPDEDCSVDPVCGDGQQCCLDVNTSGSV